ncbi:hypothetical protein EHQ58_16545 [Leptospira ognonensis]|uniref:Lipoprotein n=1 Tax=Leptospira ognonensis TaxID=2484945 RepID=A0A4V3JQL1_9LEPT|nr:hypothetical protein [Leptospira ognonensis]TGL56245.1 hypothetical protein EHQ58_16545 [Leptospira ognonensis]
MKTIFSFLIIVTMIGCASHPITYSGSKALTPYPLNGKSKILLLTYMSNKETDITVSIANTNQKYYAEIKDVASLSKDLPKSFSANVNAVLVSSEILSSSPTFTALDEKYKFQKNYLNLNQGMLILTDEDLLLIPKIASETKVDAILLMRADFKIVTMGDFTVDVHGLLFDPKGNLSYSNTASGGGSFANVSDDSLDGAGAKAGALLNALNMTFVHNKTTGLQPILVEATKKVLDQYFVNFATTTNLAKKKK